MAAWPFFRTLGCGAAVAQQTLTLLIQVQPLSSQSSPHGLKSRLLRQITALEKPLGWFSFMSVMVIWFDKSQFTEETSKDEI